MSFKVHDLPGKTLMLFLRSQKSIQQWVHERDLNVPVQEANALHELEQCHII